MFESLQILKILNYGFNYFLEQGDSRVKEWPMMQNPFPGIVMIVGYIYFVKVIGPQWMKHKQPYDLRYIMTLYNFAMVFANLTIFIGLGWFGYFNGYSLYCQPVDYSNRYEAVKMAEMGWWFYITKFIEFADTVFFVLRKKEAHISALHVIHHSIVPFSLWFGIKFAPGGYNAFFPFLNSFVHVIMYTYYGLAALGPRFQKYLFWKKYMTYIQMGQFVFVVIYAMALYFGGCNISRAFIAMNFVHALLFLALFYNFYKNAYGISKQKKCKANLEVHQNGKLCNGDHVTSLDKDVYEKIKAGRNGFIKNGVRPLENVTASLKNGVFYNDHKNNTVYTFCTLNANPRNNEEESSVVTQSAAAANGSLRERFVTES